MSMSVFRIFDNLPLLPQEMIMKHLELEDLTLLCFGAKSSRSHIKRHIGRRNKSNAILAIECKHDPFFFFLRIMFPDQYGNYERSTRQDGTFAFVFEIGDFAVKIHLFGMTYVKITSPKERTCETYLRILEVIKYLFDQADSTIDFNFPDKDFQLRVLEMCSDKDIQRLVFKSDKLRKSERQQLMGFIEKLNVTENLHFNAPVENLRRLNCKYGTFERCRLSSEDLNAFLRSWKQGNHPNVVRLEFYTTSKERYFSCITNRIQDRPKYTVEPEPFHPVEIMKGLGSTAPRGVGNRGYLDFDEFEHLHKPRSITCQELKNGWDLVNCDGKLATVIADWRRMKFIVWDNSLDFSFS